MKIYILIAIIFLNIETVISFHYRNLILNFCSKKKLIYLSDTDRNLYERIINSKEEIINSKEEINKAQNKLIDNLRGILSEKNAKIYELKGRLSFRSVFEDFENRCYDEYKTEITQGSTKREKFWNMILKLDYYGIKKYLGSSSIEWTKVAKALFKLTSEDIHKYRPEKVIINRTSMSEEMVILAEAVCKAFPISYEIISPSSSDLN